MFIEKQFVVTFPYKSINKDIRIYDFKHENMEPIFDSKKEKMDIWKKNIDKLENLQLVFHHVDKHDEFDNNKNQETIKT